MERQDRRAATDDGDGLRQEAPPARSNVLRLVAFPEHDGLRLDQFIAAASGLSRRRVRRLVAEGRLLLDDRPCRQLSRTVSLGSVADLALPQGEAPEKVPERPPAVSILFEDAWLLAADKPAGVLSQTASQRSLDPLGSRLAFDEQVLLCLAARDGARPYLRLMHRIDRATSGLLLFAKKRQALPALERAWSSGAVERRYLAWVRGSWPDGTEEERVIDRPIERDPRTTWRFRVASTDGAAGRPAITRVRLVERSDDPPASLVECRLVTGRTHQVRVHLADAGHPVIGDRLYGDHPHLNRRSRRDGAPGEAADRLLLHAASLTLPHPEDGRPLELVAPTPFDRSGPSTEAAS